MIIEDVESVKKGGMFCDLKFNLIPYSVLSPMSEETGMMYTIGGESFFIFTNIHGSETPVLPVISPMIT